MDSIVKAVFLGAGIKVLIFSYLKLQMGETRLKIINAASTEGEKNLRVFQ